MQICFVAECAPEFTELFVDKSTKNFPSGVENINPNTMRMSKQVVHIPFHGEDILFYLSAHP